MNHPKRPYLVMDIETCAAPESELVVPEFEATGNVKDPIKVAANIAAQKAKWMEDLALSALTAQIVAIGTMDEYEQPICWMADKYSEKEIIEHFLLTIQQEQTIVTFDGNRFDFPLILRRAWKHGIKVPSWLREGRYWSRRLVDCRELWAFYDKQQKGSLDEVSRFLGVGRKSGSGADFAKLLQTDPAKAREYLVNDLRLTAKVYDRIQQTF